MSPELLPRIGLIIGGSRQLTDYILDEEYIEKAIGVISRDIVFEVIIGYYENNNKFRTSYYIPKHDSSRLTEVSVEQFVDFLFESLPQYAEWFLFNPEWISK